MSKLEKTGASGSGSGTDRQVGPRAHTFERVVAGLSAIVCLLFVLTLKDISLRNLTSLLLPAPSIPASIGDRDATVRAVVVDEGGKPVPNASVRVFAMRSDRAY